MAERDDAAIEDGILEDPTEEAIGEVSTREETAELAGVDEGNDVILEARDATELDCVEEANDGILDGLLELNRTEVPVEDAEGRTTKEDGPGEELMDCAIDFEDGGTEVSTERTEEIIDGEGEAKIPEIFEDGPDDFADGGTDELTDAAEETIDCEGEAYMPETFEEGADGVTDAIDETENACDETTNCTDDITEDSPCDEAGVE